MKIALVGGTGDIGAGFAVRWGSTHDVIIGSRKSDKAVSCASESCKLLGESARIVGMDNAKAIESADLVVLCVPFETLRSVTADLIDSYTDQIVVSPVVPMSCSKHFDLMAVPEGCAAVLARDLLPKDVRVVSAFHTIAAHVLADPKKVLHGDVPICGDDKEAKAVVSGLAAQIKDLRPMDAGPLAVSRLAEGLTPMLLNVAKSSKMRNLGIQFIQA